VGEKGNWTTHGESFGKHRLEGQEVVLSNLSMGPESQPLEGVGGRQPSCMLSCKSRNRRKRDYKAVDARLEEPCEHEKCREGMAAKVISGERKGASILEAGTRALPGSRGMLSGQSLYKTYPDVIGKGRDPWSGNVGMIPE